jgi:hypothetical protein
MPTCQGILNDGEPCPKTAEAGRDYCRWHDPDEEIWREFYDTLEEVSPEERTKIVLSLIEDHPEGTLVLPERNGVKAFLAHLDLSKPTLGKLRSQFEGECPSWWNDKANEPDIIEANLEGALMAFANLQGAYLLGVNLKGAYLTGADLKETVLIDAILQDANLTGADLDQAELTGADLQMADLRGANFVGASLYSASLQDAHLEDTQLQGLDLSSTDITHISISGVWLEKTRLYRDQLGGAIGEELNGNYRDAKRGYLALKQNFNELGDYDAASWAYRKERRMEKLEVGKVARDAFSKHKWIEAISAYFKYLSDWIVELLCDYGESVWRVISWIFVLLLVAGPVLFSAIGGLDWNRELLDSYIALTSPWKRFWYNYRLYLLYSLDAFTTASFSGLQPNNDAVKIASGLFSITGIFLAGLLGFVAGNRIRRS